MKLSITCASGKLEQYKETLTNDILFDYVFIIEHSEYNEYDKYSKSLDVTFSEVPDIEKAIGSIAVKVVDLITECVISNTNDGYKIQIYDSYIE